MIPVLIRTLTRRARWRMGDSPPPPGSPWRGEPGCEAEANACDAHDRAENDIAKRTFEFHLLISFFLRNCEGVFAFNRECE